MSYSQNEEERAILEAVSGVNGPGRFLDIGAFHPKHLSNTRALFEMGWSGLMIEPSPAHMLNLLAEYGNEPRIILIQAAIGSENGLINMHIQAGEDGASSTTVESVYQTWKDTVPYIGSMLVPRIILKDLFNQFGGDYRFVSIDTEGSSVELAFDLLAVTKDIRCICVEHDNHLETLAGRMTQCGYHMSYSNQENAVFVKYR